MRQIGLSGVRVLLFSLGLRRYGARCGTVLERMLTSVDFVGILTSISNRALALVLVIYFRGVFVVMGYLRAV